VRGHIARKGARYYVVVEMGAQPAQRCIECKRRTWVDQRRLDQCARCNGELRDASERRQLWQGSYATKKEAGKAITELLAKRDAGTLTAPTRTTLESFARDEWLPEARTRLRATTVQSYEYALEKLVLPRLGHRRLTEITPAEVGGLYQALLATGGRDGEKLSGRTVQLTARVLRRVLGDAAERGYCSRNPAERVKAPTAERHEMRAWDGGQSRQFLASVADHRLRALFVFLLATGTRRGEALGLRWSDCDLDAGRVSIARALVSVGYEIQWSEPKTAKGRREIKLDSATIAELRAHRARQLEERLAAGETWQDGDLVFCREDGSPLHPQAVSKMFEKLVAAAGLPKLSLHGLRHTHATAGLRAGIPARVMQERLGHSNVAITLDIYSHVAAEMHDDAADMLGALLFGEEAT
jgi:integrase